MNCKPQSFAKFEDVPLEPRKNKYLLLSMGNPGCLSLFHGL